MVKAVETKGAMESPVVLTDKQVLEVVLDLLIPFMNMHEGILSQSRGMGIILHPKEELPVRMPVSQLELLAGVAIELEDGLKNGWGEQHGMLLQMAKPNNKPNQPKST